ncbi:MAG: DUF1571 domain-containing protein [Candidatus Aureabacteria bacterium]|nr:DUF1571 domain-containing protein [Candidatus Auribacterota bacterium]
MKNLQHHLMRRYLFGIVSACGVLYMSPGAMGGATAAISDPVAMLRKALKNYQSVWNYTAIFHKQQRVRGTLFEEEEIQLKFKKPFMVYMKWIGAIDSGREVLYIQGQQEGRILVHLGGMINYFAPSFLIHPTGTLAMRKNLRPISESGIENTITLLIGVCEKAEKNGDMEMHYLGAGKIGERTTQKWERVLPQGKGYPAHRTLVDLDSEMGYPLSVISYGWNGELLEKYLYLDLRTNVGLTGKDFERGNRDYGFGYVTVPIP